MPQQQPRPTFGGVKVRNAQDINKSLFCELCQLLLLRPMQLTCCGTRVCRWCSKTGISDTVPFRCPFCHVEDSEKQVRVDRGAERELNSTLVECYSCPWTGSYKDYQEHLQEHHAELECADCHAHFYAINLFQEHRHELCDYRCIPCGLPGCTDPIRWSEIDKHYLQQTHQKRLAEFVRAYLTTKNRSSSSCGGSQTSENNEDNTTADWTGVRQSIDIIAPGFVMLDSEFGRLAAELAQAKTTHDRSVSRKNELAKLGDRNGEKVNESTQRQNELDKELDETTKLYSLTKIVLLGPDDATTLVFYKQRDDIHPSFSLSTSMVKTSPYGYVFRVRVCATGTSTSEDQDYLSIFVGLVRGEYDAILVYPFPYDISMSLCDQSGQGQDIVSTITPDPNSASFGRPSDETISEVGVSKFCPLSYLTDTGNIYLKDGVYLIRFSMRYLRKESISSLSPKVERSFWCLYFY